MKVVEDCVVVEEISAHRHNFGGESPQPSFAMFLWGRAFSLLLSKDDARIAGCLGWTVDNSGL